MSLGSVKSAVSAVSAFAKFSEFKFCEPITRVLQEIGFVEPTEIQTRAMPPILEGKDVVASAETGSGKTAAYALPLIELTENVGKPRILVLVPTRELAQQVGKEFERFSKYARKYVVTVYGGTSFGMQLQALRRGADVIVATPGRLLDHMQQRSVDLSRIDKLVLDEADRLMDMGFMPQVRKIISRLPKERQTLMFSATIDRRIEQIAGEFLRTPQVVKANSNRVEPSQIEQRLYHVHEFGKDALLAKLVKEGDARTMLVFTQTRRKATWVKERLRESNVLAEEIHGDLSQRQRERTLARYRQGQFSVLVATDVASRGLDIPHISHVVNYDLPNTASEYVHRIGRTGRAGRAGVALSFVSAEQRHLIRDIERVTGRQLDPNADKQAPRQSNRSGRNSSARRFRPRSR